MSFTLPEVNRLKFCPVLSPALQSRAMPNISNALKAQKAAFIFSLLDEDPHLSQVKINAALLKEFNEGMALLNIGNVRKDWIRAQARKQGASPRARAEASDAPPSEGTARLVQIRAQGRQEANPKDRGAKIDAWKKAQTDLEMAREVFRQATERHAEAVLDLCVLAGGQRVLLRGRLYDFVGNNQIAMVPADDVFDLEYSS